MRRGKVFDACFAAVSVASEQKAAVMEVNVMFVVFFHIHS